MAAEVAAEEPVVVASEPEVADEADEPEAETVATDGGTRFRRRGDRRRRDHRTPRGGRVWQSSPSLVARSPGSLTAPPHSSTERLLSTRGVYLSLGGVGGAWQNQTHVRRHVRRGLDRRHGCGVSVGVGGHRVAVGIGGGVGCASRQRSGREHPLAYRSVRGGPPRCRRRRTSAGRGRRAMTTPSSPSPDHGADLEAGDHEPSRTGRHSPLVPILAVAGVVAAIGAVLFAILILRDSGSPSTETTTSPSVAAPVPGPIASSGKLAVAVNVPYPPNDSRIPAARSWGSK